MAQVDSLLRMLAQHQGDELVLTLGEAPRLLRGGGPLRLFFPQVDQAMYDLLLGELLTEQRVAALESGEKPRFDHDVAGIGDHEVELAPRRAHFRRKKEAKAPEPEPEPPAPRPRPQPPAPAPIAAPAVTAPPPERPPPSHHLVALVEHALELGASDLHLADGEPATVRIDGRLRPLDGTHADVEALLVDQLDAEARAALDAGAGVDRAVTVAGARLRLHLYRYDGGLAAALRVLRRRSPRLADLGFPIDLSPLARLPHGLVIATGPTGSGKSTTLAALAQAALQARRGLLVTLEDPIEYTYDVPARGALVRQRQVGQHVRDFPTGLRDALREDPDVLLIGEMRDPETIQLALTAAETGHLVLTSLHARTAPSAVERIVDAYPPERQGQIRVQLADALRAVVAQRLVPRADRSGRVPVVEVLRGTTPVAHLIRDGRTAQLVSAIQTGAADGMLSLDRCLRDLVRQGRITPETAADVEG